MLLTCVLSRRLALCGLLPLVLAHAGRLYAQADPDAANLPVFTNPIDVTGLPLVMRVSVPDRESGRLVDIAVPAGFLGPKFLQLLASPLSAQFDGSGASTQTPAMGRQSGHWRAMVRAASKTGLPPKSRSSTK